jgi:hypothetical protein
MHVCLHCDVQNPWTVVCNHVVENMLCTTIFIFLFLGRAGCEIFTKRKIWQPCPKKGQGWLGRGV